MYGWLQSREPNHGREHHVDGTSLDNVAQGAGSGIYLHVGHVGHQLAQLTVACLVGDNYGGRLEPVSLACQLLNAVVGRKAVHLVEVGMLLYNVESLSAYAPG